MNNGLCTSYGRSLDVPRTPSIQYKSDLSKQSKVLASGSLAGYQRIVGRAGRRAARSQTGEETARLCLQDSLLLKTRLMGWSGGVAGKEWLALSANVESLHRLWHLSWSLTKIPAVLLSGSMPCVPQSVLCPSGCPVSFSPPCPLDPTCSRVTRGRSRVHQGPILEHSPPCPR